MTYYIFDARAMDNIDDAICLYATDTIADAKEWQKEFGACVIGKDKGKTIEIMPETFNQIDK